MNPLVCIRKDHRMPPVASKHGVCDLCSVPVWVADSSPPTADTIWCWECAAVEIAKSEKQGHKTMIARPTPAQLADLAAHWNKRS